MLPLAFIFNIVSDNYAEYLLYFICELIIVENILHHIVIL